MNIIKIQFEIFDTSKIKVVTDMNDYFMYMDRTLISYSKFDTNFVYKKFVVIQCFSKSALEFCCNTKRGNIENIEDINEYNFFRKW